MFKNLFSRKAEKKKSYDYLQQELEKSQEQYERMKEKLKTEITNSNRLNNQNNTLVNLLETISFTFQKHDELLLRNVELLKKSKNEELKEITKTLLNSHRSLAEEIKLNLNKLLNKKE